MTLPEPSSTAIESATEAFDAACRIADDYTGKALVVSIVVERAGVAPVSCTMASNHGGDDFRPDCNADVHALLRGTVSVLLEALDIADRNARFQVGWSLGEEVKLIVSVGPEGEESLPVDTPEDFAKASLKLAYHPEFTSPKSVKIPKDVPKFVERLADEVTRFFDGDEIEAHAEPIRELLEENRKELSAMMLEFPVLMEQLRSAAANPAAEKQVFVEILCDPSGEISIGRLQGTMSEALEEEMDRILIDRLELYIELTQDQMPCRLLLYLDGEERFQSWADLMSKGAQKGLMWSWLHAEAKDNNEHDSISFLAGSAMLAERWKLEGMGTSVVQVGRAKRAFENLPVKVAALHAVGRFPITYFAPKYLGRQLSQITAIKASAS